MSFKIDRRDLLRGTLGAGVGLLPLLGAPSRARAQGAFPTRLLVWFTPQEPIDPAHWMPGAGFKLTPVMTSLEPYKSKILMLGDMTVGSADSDPVAAGHNLIGHILTGRVNKYFGAKFQFYASGISVDQYIAKKLNSKHVVLGVNAGGSFGTARMVYSAADQPVHPENDPQKAFANIFANFSAPPAQVDDLNARKRSVLDVIGKHVTSLKSQISSADYIKLDRHLTQVRDLEAKLNAPAGQGALTCEKNAPPANGDTPSVTRAQSDLAVQTLACNLARVVTLQVGSSGGFATPNWPAEGVVSTKNDHDIAHEYYSMKIVGIREDLERYHYNQFAYLLKQMDSVKEGDGTLLDHTVVLWVKSMSHGHGHTKMMLMLAGGANGQLKGGRYKSFPGKSTHNALINVMNLMGINETTFGDPQFNQGAFDLS